MLESGPIEQRTAGRLAATSIINENETFLPWYQEKVFHGEDSQALEQVAQRSFEVPSLEVLQTLCHLLCSGSDPALSRGWIGDVLRSLPTRAMPRFTVREEGVQEEKTSMCYLSVCSFGLSSTSKHNSYPLWFLSVQFVQSSNNASLSRRIIILNYFGKLVHVFIIFTIYFIFKAALGLADFFSVLVTNSFLTLLHRWYNSDLLYSCGVGGRMVGLGCD